jgi:hypothetical protein
MPLKSVRINRNITVSSIRCDSYFMAELYREYKFIVQFDEKYKKIVPIHRKHVKNRRFLNLF